MTSGFHLLIIDDDDVYTFGTDVPGIAQADQIVWYVVGKRWVRTRAKVQ